VPRRAEYSLFDGLFDAALPQVLPANRADCGRRYQRIVDNIMLMAQSVAMTPEGAENRADAARALLLRRGANELARRPWQHPNQAPEDAELVRFALWRTAGHVGTAQTSELEAGLALIDFARSELDALETALVFTARAEGLSWARIAQTMGMRSPQAAQQRYQRTAERQPAANSHWSAGEDHA
jgi:hypothetical protein